MNYPAQQPKVCHPYSNDFFLSFFSFSTVKKKNGVCQKISAHCVGFHSTCASVGAHPRSFLCTNKKEKGGHFFLSLLCRRRGWFHCFPICATLVKTLLLKLRHFSCFIILVFFFPVQHKEETKKKNREDAEWMEEKRKEEDVWKVWAPFATQPTHQKRGKTNWYCNNQNGRARSWCWILLFWLFKI